MGLHHTVQIFLFVVILLSSGEVLLTVLQSGMVLVGQNSLLD